MRLSLLIIGVFLSCHLPRQKSLCQLEGKVLLSNELDGCQWLIQTPNGRKLLPQNAQDFPLSDQQDIYFSYQLYDGMSICMAEDEIITITCFQEKMTITCPQYQGWEDIEWIAAIIESGSIIRVDLYSVEHMNLFRFVELGGDVLWYNCQGQKVCDQALGCDLPKNLKDPVTIFLAQR